MDIRQLSYFVEVADQHSFTKAAQKLNISQPALSKCILNLEDELGMNLFIRGLGNLMLTESGKIALENAKDLLAHFSYMQKVLLELGGEHKKSISMGCSALVSAFFGNKQMNAFFEKGKNFDFYRFESSSDCLIQKVLLMEADFSVCLLCGDILYKDFGKVSADIFYQGNFMAVVKRERKGCAAFFEDVPNLDKIVTTYELFPLVLSMEKGPITIFYTDQLDDMKWNVLEEGFIALVPDIIVPFFGKEVCALELQKPIPYKLVFITSPAVKYLKIVKELKKHILQIFQNSLS